MMEKKKLSSLISLALVALAANAQTSFTDILRKDVPGKGKVTVQQTSSIDSLVNGKTKVAPVTTPSTESPRPVAKTETTAPATPATTSGSRTSEITETEVDLRKKVMRNSYKVTGYRVQFFSGGNQRVDRQRAEQAGVTIKKMFPNEPVYVHFYSPSWKGRMGNYRDYAEAQRILKQVKTVFPQACIVKGKINIQY